MDERGVGRSEGLTHAQGNGSLMRLAPVPLLYHATPSLAIDLSAKRSDHPLRNHRPFSPLLLIYLLIYSQIEGSSSLTCLCSSLTTHGSILAVDACRYFAALLVSLSYSVHGYYFDY